MKLQLETLLAVLLFTIVAIVPERSMALNLHDSYVGRLLVDGRDVCTGTLVSPSLVLTAGHCIQPAGQSKPVEIQRIRFLLKSPEDKKRRVYSAADLGMMPQFSYRSNLNPGIPSLQLDIALIKLDGIATRADFEQVGNPTMLNGISYIPARISDDHSPEGLEGCITQLQKSQLLVLSCTREEGFSGSPVFSMQGQSRRLVGVVTAKSVRSGVNVLYASVPHLQIPQMVWMNSKGSHQIQMLSSD